MGIKIPLSNTTASLLSPSYGLQRIVETNNGTSIIFIKGCPGNTDSVFRQKKYKSTDC